MTDLRELSFASSTVLTIGKFDGVHVGHQAILEEALQIRDQLRRTRDPESQFVVLTFDPLPSSFFNPEGAFKLINSPSVRSDLLLDAGADQCVVQTFDTKLANLDASEFVQLIKKHLNMKALVIGYDFALGKSRKGTGPMLQHWGEEQGFQVRVVEDVRREGYAVRSNTIRQLLERGEVSRARDHLGRSHFVVGQVKTGVRLARRLGFPTANLSSEDAVCFPQNGVYATWTWLTDPFGIYASVTNIGFRPTFEGVEFRVETHLLDYPEGISEDHLYGQRVAVSFEERLRPEIKFGSVEDLGAQVQVDIKDARKLLASNKGDGLSPNLVQSILQ